MYGFVIKKSFCDGWDNLFTLVISNVVFLLIGVGFLFLGAKCVLMFPEGDNSLLFFGLMALLIFLCVSIFSILSVAFGELACKVADFDSISLLDFVKAIPGSIKDGLLFALFVCVVTYISIYSIYFYMFETQSLIGIFVGALIFWVDIFLLLSLQWFIPLRSLMHNNFLKCLKKCFIIFFDNTGLSILVFLQTIFMAIISVFPFIGFLPSVCGVLINNSNALRILMYKYDYLEEHPELKTKKERKQIPWEELIYDDRETLGPRTFKSFIFPWKE